MYAFPIHSNKKSVKTWLWNSLLITGICEYYFIYFFLLKTIHIFSKILFLLKYWKIVTLCLDDHFINNCYLITIYKCTIVSKPSGIIMAVTLNFVGLLNNFLAWKSTFLGWISIISISLSKFLILTTVKKVVKLFI